MNSRRLLATIVATLALTGTVTGVVLAATDSHTTVDLTALGKNAPRSAAMTFTIENADGTTINGEASMDMRAGRDAIDGYIEFPVIIAKAHINLRVIEGKLYVGSPMLRSTLGASWLSNDVGSMDLAGLALEMANPEFALLTQGLGVRPTITHDGDHTIRTYTADALGAMNLGRDVEATITTGAQGQILDAVIRVLPSKSGVQQVPSGKKSTASDGAAMTISIHMVSYNQPVSIAAPKKSDVKPMTSEALNGLAGGNPLLKGLLGGSTLNSLNGGLPL